ncbi:MAG: hypothetical protein RIS35_2326 [Pseudomonadota bacterium]|jgi:hypothetical protein
MRQAGSTWAGEQRARRADRLTHSDMNGNAPGTDEFDERRFDDRAGFDDAVLRVIGAARTSLLMIDRDFASWPIESPSGELALRTALQAGVQIRMLIMDPDWLSRHGARFFRIRRVFSMRIDCRRAPEWLRDPDCAIVADRLHVARRIPPARMRGVLALDAPTLAASVCERPDAVWEASEPCLPATTLGL